MPNETRTDTLTPQQLRLTEKLIASEEYWRGLANIQSDQIRIHDKNVALYEERITLMLQNEATYKKKVEGLTNDISKLSNDNEKLDSKVKRRNHVILGTALFAILEGMLIVLLTK